MIDIWGGVKQEVFFLSLLTGSFFTFLFRLLYEFIRRRYFTTSWFKSLTGKYQGNIFQPNIPEAEGVLQLSIRGVPRVKGVLKANYRDIGPQTISMQGHFRQNHALTLEYENNDPRCIQVGVIYLEFIGNGVLSGNFSGYFRDEHGVEIKAEGNVRFEPIPKVSFVKLLWTRHLGLST